MSKTHIQQLLELYEQHTCLWDPKNIKYNNESARMAALEEMIQKLGVKMTPLEMRMKIKNVRTIYCKLVNRIESSKDSGSGKVFRPRLKWFPYADKFLRRVVEEKRRKTRDNKASNADDNKTSKSPLLLKNQHDFSDSDVIMDSNDPLDEETVYVSEIMSGNELPAPTYFADSEASEATSKPKEDDEFDIFCKHVACQLRSLPLPNAIMCQSFISSHLAEERLKVIYGKASQSAATIASEDIGDIKEEIN